MKHYELIIEKRQPTCGGRTPTASEVLEVETDDIVAFVLNREPGVSVEVAQADEKTTIVSFVRNGLWVKYEFVSD